MKKTVFLLLTALLMFAAAACSTPSLEKSPYDGEQKSTDIQMTVNDQPVAGNAESVSLTITNASDKPYTYGVASTIEMEKDDAWYVLEPNEDIAWIEIAYTIASGESNEESVMLNEYYNTLEAGNYRVVKTFTDPEGNSLMAFGMFTVE